MSDFTQQQVIDYLMGENGTFSERKSARIAVQRIKQQAETIEQLMRQRDSYRHEANALNLENEQQAKTIANLQFHNKGLQTEANALKSENNQLKSELNSVAAYKDKLTAAVSVLVDQCKSGEVSLGAIYDVDILLGE